MKRLTTRTRSNLSKYQAGIPINGNAMKALVDKGLAEPKRRPQPKFALGDVWRKVMA